MKILLTGPECSGKTSLALHLKTILAATIIEEFARSYVEHRKQIFLEDLEVIAARQMQLDFTSKGEIVICDTGPYVLHIWAEEKFDIIPESIRQFTTKSNHDLVFLCKPNIPWVADGQRENPFDRDRLFHRYEQLLKQEQVKYKILEGDIRSRAEMVLKAIKKGA